MWYPEKRLLKMLGVKPGQGDDNDYLDAAVALAKKEGFTNDQIEEALALQYEDERQTLIEQVPKDKMEAFLIALTKRIQARDKASSTSTNQSSPQQLTKSLTQPQCYNPHPARSQRRSRAS